MPTLSDRAANTALYTFEASQLTSDTFQVVRFEGTEGLSQLFEFTLQLVSAESEVDFDKVVNKPATFTLMRGDEEAPFHGIVTNFSQSGRTSDYVSYTATLRPRLWRLGLSKRSRIFQEMSVEDILREVLKEDGLSSSDFKFDLSGSYSPREYCVQYQETDFNFVSRLMEVEGMYYFFDHSGGQDKLVVTDQRGTHETIADPSTIRYRDDGGGMRQGGHETVRSLSCEQKVVTGKVQTTDYNYRTPETVSAEAEVNSDMPGTHAEYGENVQKSDRGKRLAKVRSEAIEARRKVFRAQSNCMGMRSGALFTLEQHFRPGFNQDYLLVTVQHEGSQRAGLSIDSTAGDGQETAYQNTFKAIPAKTQFRPERTTPKPEAPGVMTATTESAGGDYAYIDDQGRYRAQMHFDDRSDRSDGTKTLPIRMQQINSGPDYGVHFPNHADTEMVVAFENGDIDRPVALGTVPNPNNPSPAVSENKMENVIRTFGGNELLMDDTKEEARVRMQSAENHQLVMDDKNDNVRVITTGEHEVLLDDKNKRIQVQTAKGRKILLDDKNEKMSVVSKKGHFLHLSDKNDSLTVADKDEKHVLTLDYKNEKMSLTTEGDIGLEAKGAVEIKGESVLIETKKDTTIDAGGNLAQKAGKNATLEASSNAEVTAGSNLTAEATQNMDLSGMNVSISGSQKFAAEGSMKAQLKGAQVSVQGQAKTELKGAMLMLNG